MGQISQGVHKLNDRTSQMKKTDRARDEQRLLLYIYELIDWLIDWLDRCDWSKGGEHWEVNESCKQDSHGI